MTGRLDMRVYPVRLRTSACADITLRAAKASAKNSAAVPQSPQRCQLPRPACHRARIRSGPLRRCENRDRGAAGRGEEVTLSNLAGGMFFIPTRSNKRGVRTIRSRTPRFDFKHKPTRPDHAARRIVGLLAAAVQCSGGLASRPLRLVRRRKLVHPAADERNAVRPLGNASGRKDEAAENREGEQAPQPKRQAMVGVAVG